LRTADITFDILNHLVGEVGLMALTYTFLVPSESTREGTIPAWTFFSFSILINDKKSSTASGDVWICTTIREPVRVMGFGNAAA
jgi:hypothetical protein